MLYIFKHPKSISTQVFFLLHPLLFWWVDNETFTNTPKWPTSVKLFPGFHGMKVLLVSMYGMLMKRNLSTDTFHKSPCTCYRVSLHNFSVEPLYYWAEELWLSDWGFHADHHKIKSSSPQYLFHIPYHLLYKFMYIYFSGRSLYLNSLFRLQHTPWHIDTHRTPRC